MEKRKQLLKDKTDEPEEEWEIDLSVKLVEVFKK